MGRKRQKDLTSFGEFLQQALDRSGKTWGGIDLLLKKWQREHPEEAKRLKLTSGQLSHDKTGRNQSMPRERLELYSQLFSVPYNQLVRRWVEWRYQIDIEEPTESPSSFSPDHEELHRQLEAILKAGGEWKNGIRLNIESIYKNLIGQADAEEKPKASKKAGQAKGEPRVRRKRA